MKYHPAMHIIILLCKLTYKESRHTYHIAGKLVGELNLAVWRSALATAKIKICQYICGDPVLNHPI